VIPWAEVEDRLREEAYEALDNDPQILLERDAWFDVDADLFHARLIGFEDEIVAEWWIHRVEPILLVPIHQSFRTMVREATDQQFLDSAGIYDTGLGFQPIRTARYVLQSGFATLSVDGMYSPPVERLRPDNTARVAFLRYRRRA
jgi:hypothetical protein